MEQIVFDRYAIFQTGGKQYQAIEGKTIEVELLDAPEGSEVLFPEVLLRKESAGAVSFGQPYLDKPVRGEVVKHGKGPKIEVFKFKRRKQYSVKQGHRQAHTIVRIKSI